MLPLVNAALRLIRPLDYRRADECRRVLQWLDPRPADRILDVGCGDGFYDRRMAVAGADVIAIDGCRKRVALAQRRNPHPRVQYVPMRAENLQFSPRSFTKAVSICVLEHIPDDEAALREIASVLLPGARLVLSCDSLSNSGVTAALRARHATRYAVRHFYSRDLLAERLERSGFTLRRMEYVLTTPISLAIARATYVLDDIGRLPGGWAPKYAGLSVAGTLGLPVSRLSERLAGRATEGLTLIAEAYRNESP
jgi:SAM-dependent methyltransferase